MSSVRPECASVTVRLHCITHAAELINLYEFRPLIGDTLPPFEAGAHIDLELPNGLTRQYSLVNDQSERHRYVVGVKRDAKSRGGSAYIADHLKVGSTIQIVGPRNNFRLNETAPHSVLIAGGIGVTPIWSMIQRLHHIGGSWELHYAARSRRDLAFSEELKLHGSRARLHVDDEFGGEVMDIRAIVVAAPAAAHLYCCGPAPMLASFEEVTQARPRAEVHLERFSAAPLPATGGAYKLELARSGKVIEVGPGQTALEMLRENGINVPFSCEQGICGACETRVVSGIPDHRDMILSPEEQATNKTMMICCSGSKSDVLVLDL